MLLINSAYRNYTIYDISPKSGNCLGIQRCQSQYYFSPFLNVYAVTVANYYF